jgi:hypothetical protein
MDWIRENKPLAAILGVILVGTLALGYLLFDAWSVYTETKEGYQSLGSQMAALKNEPLAPTDANLKSKQDAVKEYATLVNRLGSALLILQKPVEPIKEIEFQAKLKAKISETRTLATQAKLQLPADFAFGFEEYTGKLPVSAAAATELSGYLDVLNELVKVVRESGVQSLDLLQRSKLPIETQAPTAPQPNNNMGKQAQAPAGITEKRQIVMILTLDQGPLQLLVSRLTNPSDMPYFTTVRLLRIENEVQDGPLVSAVRIPTVDKNKLINGDQANQVKKEEVPSDEIRPPDPEPVDAVQVFGNERLRVRVEIDLVRFLDAAQGVAVQAPAGR